MRELTELTRLPVPTSAPAEQPSSSARLELSVRPDGIKGTAEGIVPPPVAPALIRTFGVITMGVAGLTGATITLYVAPPRVLAWFFSLAMAELVLALIVIVLIARRDRDHLAGAEGSQGQAQSARRRAGGIPGQDDRPSSA
jgi:hypothetical protein